jgi:hypothetical protein
MGIASCILFGIAVLALIGGFVTTMRAFTTGDMPNLLGLAAVALLFWACIPVGFLLGVIAAFTSRRKAWAIAGCILNGLVLLLVVVGMIGRHA